MVRTLRTFMLAGLGALDVTDEKVREIVNELVERGEVAQKEARDLVATWTKRATERRTAFANQIRETVRQELKVNQVSREEFDALAALVARLERRMTPADDVPVRR